MKCKNCNLYDECSFRNRIFDIDNSDHKYKVIGCKDGGDSILIKRVGIRQ